MAVPRGKQPVKVSCGLNCPLALPCILSCPRQGKVSALRLHFSRRVKSSGSVPSAQCYNMQPRSPRSLRRSFLFVIIAYRTSSSYPRGALGLWAVYSPEQPKQLGKEDNVQHCPRGPCIQKHMSWSPAHHALFSSFCLWAIHSITS